MNPKEAIKVLCAMHMDAAQSRAINAAIDALKEQDPTCGSCKAGILLMRRADEPEDVPPHVEACDTCKLFETDEDAEAAVEALLSLLHRVYRARYHREGTDTSVAGALDYIEKAVG